jgi:hypothetical protein
VRLRVDAIKTKNKSGVKQEIWTKGILQGMRIGYWRVRVAATDNVFGRRSSERKRWQAGRPPYNGCQIVGQARRLPGMDAACTDNVFTRRSSELRNFSRAVSPALQCEDSVELGAQYFQGRG